MNPLLALIIGILLAACAGPTYYPAQPSGEGSYYIARSPGATTITPYDAAYGFSSFPAYGIYPWWSYSYYSPYFYPHYFSIWQPGWPYDAGGHWVRHGGNPHGFNHGGRHAHDWPQRYRPVPATAWAESPIPSAPPTAVGPGPGRQAATLPEPYRQESRWRGLRRQVGSVSEQRRPQRMTGPSGTVPAAPAFESPAAAAPTPRFRVSSLPAMPVSGGRTVHFRDTSDRSALQRDP
jgi:hypothetical protein